MEELPVDRGWAWVICGAMFVYQFFASSAYKVLAITLLDLRDKFDTSLTVISLVFMFKLLCLGISSIASVNFLVPAFGIRRVCTTSACVYTLCGIGYAFSPNVYVFLTLATIRGIVSGILMIPSVELMGFYFKKYRSRAITGAICGSSVASMSWPPFVRYLMSKYGLQGALMLTGALEGHIIVSTMLYRPLSSYRIPKDDDDVKEPTQNDLSFPQIDEKSTNLNKNDGYPTQDNKDIYNIARDKCMVSGADGAENEPTVNDSLLKNVDSSSLRIGLVPSNGEPNESVVNYHIPYSKHSESQATSDDSYKNGLLDASLGANGEKATAFKYSSAWSLASGLEGVGGVVLQVEAIPNEPQTSKLRQIFDFSLFKNWGFVWCMLATMPTCAIYITTNYLPTIGAYKGVSKEEGALLLTIIGAVDLASRMAVGVLADSKLLRVTTIIGLSMGLLGVVCLFVEFFNYLEGMIAMTVLMGLFAGIRMSLTSLMYIEVVGLDRMAKAFSIHTLFVTIINSAYNPLFGHILEKSGVDVAVYFSGILLVLAGLIVGTTPLLKRLQATCMRNRLEE